MNVRDINESESLLAFQNYNPAFLYEKRNIYPSGVRYRVDTHLKWINNDYRESRVSGYLEALLLLVRNKVLLNQGNLQTVRIIWFYPVKMFEYQLVRLERLWENLATSIFPSKNFPQRIPESIAPYYWFWYNRNIFSSVKNAVCVDIGGGTSDIAVFREDLPLLITSFQFGANSIFCDDDGYFPKPNGIVRKYSDKIRYKLQANALFDLEQMFQDILSTQNSDNIVSFFFSLHNNKEIKSKTKIDFNEMLSNDETFKIVFFLFYTAIIYHTARLMYALQHEIPGTIAFSGNGSKVLKVLSNKSAPLEHLTMLIFDKVYLNSKKNVGLRIYFDYENSKKSTCKGGLQFSKNLDFAKLPDQNLALDATQSVLLGTKDNRLRERTDKYKTINKQTIELVAEEIQSFFELIIGLDDELDLKNMFNINIRSLRDFREVLLKDSYEIVAESVRHKQKYMDPDDILEESLFFSPFRTCINLLVSLIESVDLDS